MIDDENLHGSIFRFQFQAKLFLKRGEDCSLALLWRQLQGEIMLALESSPIHNDAAAQFPRQILH